MSAILLILKRVAMRLWHKILLIFFILITSYAFVSYAALRELVFASYLSLEKSEARKDILRCLESIRREIVCLDTVTNDWAAWNDMYSFVYNPDPLFITSNLIPETFTYNHLDLICIYNMEKKAVWGQIWDQNSGKPIGLTEFHPDPGHRVHVFFQINGPEDSVSGLFRTDRGPMMVASRPITTSDHRSPVRGYLIMGKFIDQTVMDVLREQTQVEQEIIPLPLSPLSQEVYKTVLDCISTEKPIVFETPTQDILQAFAVIPDVTGNPGLLIKATLNRDIHQKGAVTLKFVFGWIVVSALILSGVFLILLRRLVICPVTNLTRCVTTISSKDNPMPQRILGENDEVRILLEVFKEMADRIQSTRHQLEIINEELILESAERKTVEEDLRRHRSELCKMSVDLLLAEERERRRIAADLHDRIGQGLAVVQIRLDILAQNMAADNSSQALCELSHFMDDVIKDTRTLIFDISPPVLYEMGLEAAVEWLSEDLVKKYGIPISTCCIPGPIPMAIDVRVSGYRAVRELLHNALKHSEATVVSVRIHQENTQLRIEVSDNGKGFDLSANVGSLRKPGFGVFSIRENLRALGGSIDIRTKLNMGTCVILYLPLEKEQPKIEGNCHGHQNYTC